jgi:hypothetical protein
VTAAPQPIDNPLDRIAPEAGDLLRRVDLVIGQLGVPSGHPLVPLLARLRLRPGEALRALLDVRPDDLHAAAASLRRLAAGYRADVVAPLHRSVGELGWRGAGFDAFAERWTALARHIAADDASMAARLEATAEFAESVAGWFVRARQALAVVLTEAFGSTEAVVLRSCQALDTDGAGLRRALVTGEIEAGVRLVEAAVGIGAAVLDAVSRWYEVAVESFGGDGHLDRTAPLSDPRVSSADVPADGAGWVRL